MTEGRQRRFGQLSDEVSETEVDLLTYGGYLKLSELLSLCAHLRAEGLPGDGEAWAATVTALDGDPQARGDARDRALALHAQRVE